MDEPRRLSPVVERHTRQDGSEYFLTWVEEFPGFVIQDDSFTNALYLLRLEMRSLAAQAGIPGGYVPYMPDEWTHRQSPNMSDVSVGTFITFEWNRRSHRAATHGATPPRAQRTLWEDAQQQ